MNNIPYQIQKQRQQLQELTDSKALFGSMVKLRDVTEVMLRLPVLCAGAFILAKGGSEKELLTLELVRRDKIDSRGWLQVANSIHKNGNIPKPLKTIIDRVCHWITSEKLIDWRHSEVAHGALKFNPDKAFVKDFGKKIKSLDKLLKQLEKDYKDISVSDNGSTVTYMGEALPVAPYIYSDSGEAYLFDTYRNGLAKGLCYDLGVKRAMPSEAYVQAYMAQADRLQASGVTGEVITAEMSAAIDELNEAANFEYPTYLRDWLVEGMNAGGSGITKGTLLLEMERGMGKSAFARALDGKSTDSSYQSFKIGDTFTRGYYCSRVGIRSKGDFLFGVRNSLLTDEKDQLLYSSDEKIPSLSENGTPEDFAALLNWCRDHVSEKRLLLIIDGIDEIPAEHSDILKMLPTAEMLKDGVYILITCRSKEQVTDEIKNKKDEELSDKEKQYKKLLEDENRQIETVRSYIHPDRERAYSRDEQHNLETLTSYFNRKILPKDGKKNKKNKKNDKLEADIQTIINEPGQRRFLEVRIIGTLIKSGKVKDIAAFAKHPDLFQYYLDYLRTEEYGDVVFSRLTELLAALACAQEELTFGELAYLLGEDDVTMQLLTFVCDMAGILRISRDYRGNHISLASDEYRTRILEAFPDTVQLHKQAVADILECVDIEALKAQANDKDDPLPDGLLYTAAYLLKYTDQISEKVFNKVYVDVNDCIKNSIKRIILSRRITLGKIWESYFEKHDLKEKQLTILNDIGNSYYRLNEIELAIEIGNKQIELLRSCMNSNVLVLPDQLPGILINQGARLQEIGLYEQALKFYNDGIDIRKQLLNNAIIQDKIDLAKDYNNRGSLLSILHKSTEALLDINACLNILREIESQGRKIDNNLLSVAYFTRGTIYGENGRLSESLEDYQKCLSIRESLLSDNALPDIFQLSNVYLNISITLRRLHKYVNAIMYCTKSIDIMSGLQDKKELYKKEALADAYGNRGQIFIEVQKFDNALSDFNKCIIIREELRKEGKKHRVESLANEYLTRGYIYIVLEMPEKALHDYDSSIEIFETLHRNSKLFEIGKLAVALLNKGYLLLDGRNDQIGAIKHWNHAIELLKSKTNLSSTEKEVLDELIHAIRESKGNYPQPTLSIQTMLEAMSDKELNQFIDKLIIEVGEEKAILFKSLLDMDRKVKILLLSQMLQ